MSPITKIALRRIKKNSRKSIFLTIAVLFSMLMISFFIFFQLQTLAVQNPAYKGLPFTEFMNKVRMSMNVTVVTLVIITFLTVRTYCSMRNEENKEALAVLTSVGATNFQKRKLIATEVVILYLPPTLIGVCLGMIPGVSLGNLFAGGSEIATSSYLSYVLFALMLVIAGMLLISLCYLLPNISFKRRSVIQSVKKQNTEASEQRHGYRQSYTFRSQSLLKRLAKKSIDYYGTVYNKIALSFASSVMYPLLAILLFWNIGNADIVLDTNPYDGIDTTTAVLAVVDKILVFLGLCFLVLTFVGIMQAVFMARMQILARKESAHIYLSIGMPETDIQKMIRLEIKSVLFRSFIYLIFAGVIVSALFGMAVA